jgi:hypothetical protein
MNEKDIWLELAEACEKAQKENANIPYGLHSTGPVGFLVRDRYCYGLCDGLRILSRGYTNSNVICSFPVGNFFYKLKSKLPTVPKDTEWGQDGYCWPLGDHAARAAFCRKMVLSLTTDSKAI